MNYHFILYFFRSDHLTLHIISMSLMRNIILSIMSLLQGFSYSDSPNAKEREAAEQMNRVAIKCNICSLVTFVIILIIMIVIIIIYSSRH